MDPLGRAVLEALDQGIALFDAGGRFVYANPAARRLLASTNGDGQDPRHVLLSRQGRAVPLSDGETMLGEAVLLSGDGAGPSLADRERQAIIETIAATGGRLAEASRRLGISRTTLWRRLRSYGAPRSPGAAS